MRELYGIKTDRTFKKLKLNGIPIKRNCEDCNKEFSEYIWSPFWCPPCDAKRIKRIDKAFAEISERFKKKLEEQNPNPGAT